MLREIARFHQRATGLLCRVGDDKYFTPLGSAFACHRDGYFLTCAHTFSLTDSLAFLPDERSDEFVSTQLNQAEVLELRVAQYDAVNDVALLKFTNSGVIAMADGLFQEDETMIPVGASIAYIGYPFADLNLYARHIASATVGSKVLSEAGTRRFQLDTMVHEGCSGGPAIDVCSGRIFGVISGRFSPAGVNAGFRVTAAGRPLSGDSSVSYATSIRYGLALMRAEGLYV